MSTSLSNLVDNLSGGILNYGKCVNCDSFPEYITAKNGRLLFECFDCKKRYSRKISKKFGEKLTTKFRNTYKFCNVDIDKFMILLRKRYLSL